MERRGRGAGVAGCRDNHMDISFLFIKDDVPVLGVLGSLISHP